MYDPTHVLYRHHYANTLNEFLEKQNAKQLKAFRQEMIEDKKYYFEISKSSSGWLRKSMDTFFLKRFEDIFNKINEYEIKKC